MILRKLSEDATTITLGWDLGGPGDGYRFTREKAGGRYSHTWDSSRTSARFSKDSAWYSVEELVVATGGLYPPVAPPPPPQPPPTTGLPKFGVATGYTILNRNDADRNFELDQIKQVGAGVVRFDSTPGNQGQVDRVVAGCGARGLKAILALWGTTGPSVDETFAAAQASKWKGNTTVAALEFCNEPDLHGWTPATYATLVRDAGAGVRSRDPAQKIAAGALWKGGGDAPLEYTDALISTAKGYFDYVSIHLYDDALERGSWNIWDMAYPWPGGFYNGRTVREKLDAAGLQNVPIISTESGAPSPKYSEQRVASIVTNALNEVKKGKIACACVYAMLDDDVAGFGMLRNDRSQRPSYAAYKAAAS